MKNLIIGLIVLATFGCNQPGTKKVKMGQAKTVEMVLWKAKEGISTEEAKIAIVKLNKVVASFPGFISRTTSIAEDGQFLDIVLWKDLESALKASDQVMKNEDLIPIFNTIEEKEMIFKHFEIFNAHK